MLILKAVSLGPLHGYGILLRIQQISGERLEILQGSFYAAIYRLEGRGWIKGEWGESENNRRARFYSLTPAGKRQLKAETAKWIDMTAVSEFASLPGLYLLSHRLEVALHPIYSNRDAVDQREGLRVLREYRGEHSGDNVAEPGTA